MNWDDDEEWDNCAPGAFGGDYSNKSNEEDNQIDGGIGLFDAFEFFDGLL